MTDCVSCFVPRALCAAGVVLLGFGSVWADAPTAYIETTGSQYLITDFCADPTTKVEADMTITTATTATRQQRFFGADSDQTSWPFSFSVYQNGEDKFGSAAKDGVGNWGNSGYLLSNVKNKRILLTLDAWNGGAATYLLSVADRAEGKVLKSWTATTTRTKTSSRPLGIACNNRTDSPLQLAYMKIYSVKIWKKDQLVRCYVPYWNEDKSVIGLKELFTGNVIENSGSGTLDCGGELASDPSVYLPEGWPEGCRYDSSTGKLSMRLAVTCAGVGGTVAIDGGTAAAHAEKWVELGETVTISVASQSGASVLAWEGARTPVAGGAADEYTIKMPEIPLDLTAIIGSGERMWTGDGDSDDWTDEKNWDPEGVPAAGEYVTIPADASVRVGTETATLGFVDVLGTLTFSGWTAQLKAGTVVVRSGGLVTSEGPFTDEAAKSRVNISCASLTVERGGLIDVSAKGWKCGDVSNVYGYGPGTIRLANACAGGSHGGLGSYDSGSSRSTVRLPDLKTVIYGNASAPETPGSGGYSTTGDGGSGGGVVRIAATDRVDVFGKILADGRVGRGPGSVPGDCGGAGGSIYITCRTFGGASGVVRARGGNSDAQWSRNYRSGGGGRVAIIFDKAAQAQLPVPKGMEYSADCGPLQPPGHNKFVQARPGSLYFSSDTLIDRTGATLFGALDFADVTDVWTIDTLCLTNGWATLLRTDVEMCVTGDFTVTGKTLVGRRYTTSGSFTTPGILTADTDGTRWDVGGAEYTFATNQMLVYQYPQTAPRLTVGGNLTVSHNGILQVWSGRTPRDPAAQDTATTNMGAQVTVTGAIRLESTGKLYSRCHPRTGTSPVFTAGSLSIDATSFIDSNGEGYWGNFNDKSKSCAISFPDSTGLSPKWPLYNCGGGHGGTGGWGYDSKTAVGGTYDDVATPVLPGCGGAGDFNTWIGPRGGGVVRLSVAGEVRVDGLISANGVKGSHSYCDEAGGGYSGGGAGGTVSIGCGKFSGTGMITVDGGAGKTSTATSGYNGGGGGGGRISVRYDTAQQDAATCSVALRAKGGACLMNYAGWGEAGTVYTPDDRLVRGVTTSRNAGRFYVPDALKSLTLDSLTLDGGLYAFEEGSTVSIAGAVTVLGDGIYTSGIDMTNGVFSCGSLSVSNARAMFLGGPTPEAERLRISGSMIADNAHVELNFAETDANARLDVGGGMELVNGATFQVTAANNPVQSDPGVVVTMPSLSIGENSWIYPVSAFTNGASPLFRIDGRLVCQTNAGFDASARGIGVLKVGGTLYEYEGQTLDGRGVHASDDMKKCVAPGHGGRGGFAVEPGEKFYNVTYPRGRGQTYDNRRRPVLGGLPSAGNRQGYGHTRGGGVVRIEAGELCLNGGTLRADGGKGQIFRTGSSGGSVYVRAQKLRARGATVSARGGDGSIHSATTYDQWASQSGGGGRIAIWSGTPWNEIDISTHVETGWVDEHCPERAGEEGTVYWGRLGGLMLLLR